jgi:hypothetical protein
LAVFIESGIVFSVQISETQPGIWKRKDYWHRKRTAAKEEGID